MIALIWDGILDGQLHKSSLLSFFNLFFIYFNLVFALQMAQVNRLATDDVWQYFCSQSPHNFKNLLEYVQEAILSLGRSLTVDHHHNLEAQGVGDNLLMSLVHHARGMLAAK